MITFILVLKVVLVIAIFTILFGGTMFFCLWLYEQFRIPMTSPCHNASIEWYGNKGYCSDPYCNKKVV